jgi:phosphoenolpyruvate carboxykinase (GTP)
MTAAAAGTVGQVRRDPMAMLPFCGYTMGRYFRHWLDMRKKLTEPPRIFHVNWFRKDEAGQFLWPGFGDNMRVLKWITERCAGVADAVTTPVGLMPNRADIDLTGLALTEQTLDALLAIDTEVWSKEVDDIQTFFEGFGERLPEGLKDQVGRLREAVRSGG